MVQELKAGVIFLKKKKKKKKKKGRCDLSISEYLNAPKVSWFNRAVQQITLIEKGNNYSIIREISYGNRLDLYIQCRVKLLIPRRVTKPSKTNASFFYIYIYHFLKVEV